MAPRLAAARNATSVSTLLGASATTRSPRPTPRATSPARARPTRSRSSARETVRVSPSSRAKTIADRLRGAGTLGERVLGVVQRGPGEPLGARHPPRDRAPPWARRGTAHRGTPRPPTRSPPGPRRTRCAAPRSPRRRAPAMVAHPGRELGHRGPRVPGRGSTAPRGSPWRQHASRRRTAPTVRAASQRMIRRTASSTDVSAGASRTS